MSKTARGCRARFAPVVTASGDPAMAFMFFQRLARTDTPSGSFGSYFRMVFSENRYPLFGIMLMPAYNARGIAAREMLQRRMPSLSISVL